MPIRDVSASYYYIMYVYSNYKGLLLNFFATFCKKNELNNYFLYLFMYLCSIHNQLRLIALHNLL